MEARLQWMAAKPSQWVHWEPLRGGLEAQTLLESRYPDAQCFLMESRQSSAREASIAMARPWWTVQHWRGPKRHWSAPGAPVQMAAANSALHMAPDPQATMAQWLALLAPDGFLMFSCFGPDTLAQMKHVHARHGWPAPSHEFTDMHDWGDTLVAAGFAEPVMDMERVDLSYSSPESMLNELRQLGRNLNIQRFPGLRGRAWRAQWLEAMKTGLASALEEGRLTLTFEVVYGHAFKPQPRMNVAPQTTISLDEMRASLRRPVI